MAQPSHADGPGEHDSGLVEAAPGVSPRELLRRFWPFARRGMGYRLAAWR